jgi:hypothetical protein
VHFAILIIKRMSKARKSARSIRREVARAATKLAKSRLTLASIEPGGAPERPIEVASASVVEAHARGLPCAACAALGVRVEEHSAVAFDDTAGRPRVLRAARVYCPQCGLRRDVYFRIGSALPS